MPVVANLINIPILMYHHVVPTADVGGLTPFAVSRELFSRQMEWLVKAGFRTITLEQLFNVWEGNNRLEISGKPVIVTFDDCPLSLLNHAVPELSRRGMTATFFVVAGNSGGHNDWDAEQGAPTIPLMSGKDLRNLADNGFEIGSHGMSHCNLRKCLPDQIRWELRESKLILEDTVGRPVRFLAYPYGEYPEWYARLCLEAGYRGAVSIFSGTRTVCEDPFCVRRVLIHEGDRKIRFLFKTSGVYLFLRRFVDRKIIFSATTKP